MDESYTAADESHTTQVNKELVHILYDTSKTFCFLCNIRVESLLHHESDIAHTSRVAIFTFLTSYSQKIDVHALFAELKANHMRNPNIIPKITAVHQPQDEQWAVFHKMLMYFKSKRLLTKSVFDGGDVFSRTSEFDRFEWIGDATMRSVYARVWAQLFQGVSSIPFNASPFLNFMLSNIVIEKLFDHLGIMAIINGKYCRSEKTANAMKMRADIVESMFGELVMYMYRHDAHIFELQGILLDTAIDYKVLSKLVHHFIVDFTASHILYYFNHFASDAVRLIDSLRLQLVPNMAITHERIRYMPPPKFESEQVQMKTPSRLQSLDALGHFESNVPILKTPLVDIATKDLIAQLDTLFVNKTYFANEIHGRRDTVAFDQREFPQIDKLNDLYDGSSQYCEYSEEIARRFRTHAQLKYIYLQINTVPRPDILSQFIRRKQESEKVKTKMTDFGFPAHTSIGVQRETVFFSSYGKSCAPCRHAHTRLPVERKPWKAKPFLQECFVNIIRQLRRRHFLPMLVGAPLVARGKFLTCTEQCCLKSPWVNEYPSECPQPKHMKMDMLYKKCIQIAGLVRESLQEQKLSKIIEVKQKSGMESEQKFAVENEYFRNFYRTSQVATSPQ